MNITEISNIPVHCFNNMDEAVDYIMTTGSGKIAVAINPEKILSSLESRENKEVILSADIRYLDGIGAVKVAQSKLNKKLARIPGCELWQALMKEAGIQNKSVFLLGADKSVVNNTKKKLEKEYCTNVIATQDGFFTDDDLIIAEILELQPDILTVAMGSPRQEQFMNKCKAQGVKSFMMGVGGTYNVFTAVVKRAPKIWCDLGLEWFYRLLLEPTRIKRQVKLLKFVWLFLTKKL
jgi:UDP-N-acetyl-D-mannosaminouronate:lipid I N-acetyl-D-mannosaminouronosyltransferase